MLTELLARVIEIRNKQNFYKPILLKIAPDLSYAQLDDIVHVARTRGVDGMIVSNTTLARPTMLKSPYREEAGGLSGAPLFDASTRILAQTYLRVENQFPLIGVGGIDSPETARIKIEAGATLIQLYSALIYEGHELIEKIKNDLSQTLQREGIPLSELVTPGETLRTIITFALRSEMIMPLTLFRQRGYHDERTYLASDRRSNRACG